MLPPSLRLVVGRRGNLRATAAYGTPVSSLPIPAHEPLLLGSPKMIWYHGLIPRFLTARRPVTGVRRDQAMPLTLITRLSREALGASRISIILPR